MLNFLSLLKGAGSAIGGLFGGGGGGVGPISTPAISATQGQGGGMDTTRLGQAFGTKAAGITSGPSKIGLQYINAGINAPQLPDPMNMLAGAKSMSGQQQNQRNLPITQILNMLRGV